MKFPISTGLFLGLMMASGTLFSVEPKSRPIELADLPDEVIVDCLSGNDLATRNSLLERDYAGKLEHLLKEVRAGFAEGSTLRWLAGLNMPNTVGAKKGRSMLQRISGMSGNFDGAALIFLNAPSSRAVNLCLISRQHGKITLNSAPTPPDPGGQHGVIEPPRPDQILWLNSSIKDAHDTYKLLVGMHYEVCPNPCHQEDHYALYQLDLDKSTLELLAEESFPGGHAMTSDGRLYFISENIYEDPCGEDVFPTYRSYSVLKNWKFLPIDAQELGLKEEKAKTAYDCAPPAEPGPFLKSDLVELKTFDPSLKLDIRYATKNNFLGRPVYPEARAFLQRPAAEALVRANRALQKQALGLLIFDGYRPWSVTKTFWDETPADKHEFVADPAKGSRHNRGCAVDLTLYDLKTGQPLPMPSDYDEMNEKSHPDFAGGPPETRANRDTLRQAMEAEGFSIYPNEWWHFDCKGWKQYALMNLSFAEVTALNKPPEKKVDLGFTWPVPAGWKSETIPFPLEFAPELKHKGIEEIRFMPGFFDPASPNFWSYAFVWWLEDESTWSNVEKKLGNELELYFHGLCVTVGKEKNINCAKSRFISRLSWGGMEMMGCVITGSYQGEITIIDPFKTGKSITLQLQVRNHECPTEKRHVLLIAASPKPMQDPVWKELSKVKDSFDINKTCECWSHD